MTETDPSHPTQQDQYGFGFEPTLQQHLVADHCAAIMRASLQTNADKEVVVAILMSAVTTASEDEDWPRLVEMAANVSHAVVLDMVLPNPV